MISKGTSSITPAIAVDEHCPLAGASIHEPYTSMLNQVSVAQNSNKFYLIQIVDSGGSYHLYTRYGRVGEKGICKVQPCTNLQVAIRLFTSAYRSKTGNTWNAVASAPFVVKPKKYVQMQLDTPQVPSPVGVGATIGPAPAPTVTLQPQVTELIRLIASKEVFSQTLITLKLDERKMPLGKISAKQIADASEVLKQISGLVTGVGAMAPDRIAELSSMFWTYVPRATKRHERPPLIDSQVMITECSDTLDALQHMQVAGEVLQRGRSEVSVYHELRAELTALEPVQDLKEWEIIRRYVNNSAGSTHHYKVDLQCAYRVNKQVEDPQNVFASTANHALLFHGSRTSNFIGILSQGLRIPGISQVANGSTLGRGIYFADCVTKSFNYTGASGGTSGEVGLMLMCEVALGSPHQVQGCYNVDSLDRWCQSRKANGRQQPISQEYEKLVIDGREVIVPLGPQKCHPDCRSSTFEYNEYVVYSTLQYRFRYLLRLVRV